MGLGVSGICLEIRHDGTSGRWVRQASNHKMCAHVQVFGKICKLVVTCLKYALYRK